LSDIAAGQSVAAAVGTTMGRRRRFCCGLVVAIHRNYHERLPIQTLLLLPTTTISTVAAAGTTIAVAVLAGRLVVMSFSHDFSVCLAVV
jgi:hypothetical protein